LSLENFFQPRSIAVVGSVSPGKLGVVLLQQLMNGGFRGSLFAVNPRAEGYEKVPGFASLAGIGKTVDLAVIVSPPSTVNSVLQACGESGVKAAVIITSGFSETGNIEAERELLITARHYSMRLIGPNCAGIVNTSYHFFPTLELRPPAGDVALVSQSGALGGVVLGWAKQQELGISKFISYGNGADLNETDFLFYLADDPHTRVVALYLESVRDGRAFLRALSTCSAKKPVVVIKAGCTTAGRRATSSHTGSMAGEDAIYDSAIRQCGALRARSVEEMLDLCQAFTSLPPVSGKRIVVVTNSGGPGVLAVDRAEQLGLDVGEPSPQLQKRLRSFLPLHYSLKNPFDLTVEGSAEDYQRTLEEALAEYDGAVTVNVTTSYLDNLSQAKAIVTAQKKTGKPVLANFLPAVLVKESAAFLKQNRVPNYPSAERAIESLSGLLAYGRYRQGLENGDILPLQLDIRMDELRLPGNGQMLEPEAMAWLRENSIPVPAFHFCKDPEEVARACSDIGYPVVMKVVSPQILHKSDMGGVEIGLRDASAARGAFDRIVHAARGKDFHGVAIYPMILGALEVLVGMARDPQFGPVIAFGMGGIYTEIIRDVVLRVAPLDILEARRMIREIKSYPLLRGARGKHPGDLEALAEMLVTFSKLPFRFPQISEIDLNPVFLLPRGVVVGDVRVIQISET